MKPSLALLASLLALAPLACEGTEVGNPFHLGLAAYNVMPAAGITVDQAWLVVDRVRFRPTADCEGDADIERTDQLAIDIRTGVIPPALRELAGTSSSYCRIELRWKGLDGAVPAGAPAELAGASVVVVGTRGDGKRFVIRSTRSDELKLRARGAGIGVGGITALFAGFDLTAWLSGIDLATATVGADDVVRLDDTNNLALRDLFDDNVAAAAKLFADRDGDERLDDDERDDDDALADGEDD